MLYRSNAEMMAGYAFVIWEGRVMKIAMRQLDAFMAVMTVGTVTAAASVLNTSQPAVTRSLRQLEDATGLTLFARVRGRLEPTAEARDLIETVRDSYAGLDRIAQVAENLRRRRTGHLRIGCLPAFAQGFMARAIADLLGRHPGISLTVTPLLSSDVIKATRNRAVDIGIAAYELDVSSLETQAFTACNEVAVMPAGHPLAAQASVSPQDLSRYRLVMLAAVDPYRQRLDRLLTAHDVVPHGLVETPTSSALCAMVAQGIGIGVVNPLTALDFLTDGLVLRQFAPALPFVTTLLRRPAETAPPLVAAFQAVLEQRRDQDLARVSGLLNRAADADDPRHPPPRR